MSEYTAYPFDGAAIREKIHSEWAADTVHFVMEVDSTNDWAKREAKKGATHGTLYVTEHQTAGKGRRGRSWESPAGSCVIMTVLLRPQIRPQNASMLTLVFGLAVARAVQELGLDVSIKWPNDIVVSRKKICGILTEMNLEPGNPDRIEDVVIGIGINVNLESFPEELADKATSLYLETGRRYDRADLIGKTMMYFEDAYEKFVQTEDLSLLINIYNGLLANLNQPVRVLDQKRPFEGIARGINAAGELLVEEADGTITAVYSGEVSVRGLYSYV